MKPAIAAMTNPNSISWMCQVSGVKRLGNVSPMVSMTTHPASAAADQALAARKNGLKAIVQMANDPLLAVCTAGIAT
jgi:hypothetical protein